MSFSGEDALIIGGSSGMGLKAARVLVEKGARVTLVGRDPKKLSEVRTTFDAPDKYLPCGSREFRAEKRAEFFSAYLFNNTNHGICFEWFVQAGIRSDLKAFLN